VQKPDCSVSVKWTSPHNLVGGDSSINYWQPRFVHQLLVFVSCCTGYVPWSWDTYRIPDPFCFPFISPPMHCHVPSHTHQALHFLTPFQEVQNEYTSDSPVMMQTSTNNASVFLEIARFSAPVQTGPGAHPASCTMGTRSFPGVKSGRGMTLTPHPLLVPWSRKGRAIPLLPLWTVWPVQSLSACTRVHLTFLEIP